MEPVMKWSPPGGDFTDCREIRIEVFCDEQGYLVEDEFDDEDALSHHLLVSLGGEPIATGRILPLEENIWRLGRIAVRKPARGTGLGRVLVDEMRRKAEPRCAAHSNRRAMPSGRLL